MANCMLHILSAGVFSSLQSLPAKMEAWLQQASDEDVLTWCAQQWPQEPPHSAQQWREWLAWQYQVPAAPTTADASTGPAPKRVKLEEPATPSAAKAGVAAKQPAAAAPAAPKQPATAGTAQEESKAELLRNRVSQLRTALQTVARLATEADWACKAFLDHQEL